MSTENFDFGNVFKALLDDVIEQIALASSCKMRRFYLVRSVDTDPDKTSGIGVIAEGIVYEDGRVSMRWKTKHKSTTLYDSVVDLLAIHGHNGKTVMKYIDAEVK